MEDKFSDNNFVTRREENNIRYNSKVNFPINSYVIVENKNNNEIYEVYKSNDGIINKKIRLMEKTSPADCFAIDSCHPSYLSLPFAVP